MLYSWEAKNYRRINYLHNILRKSDDELIRRVYTVQNTNPSKGDWCNIVKSDMDMIGLNMNEQNMILLSKSKLKSLVKKCVFKSVFTSLKSAQSSHSKIKSIKYNKFEMQPYLESELFTTEETEMVFNIRANTVTGYKACFKTLYQSNMNCKLGCPVEDSIEHVFKCKKIDECSMKTNISLRAIICFFAEFCLRSVSD